NADVAKRNARKGGRQEARTPRRRVRRRAQPARAWRRDAGRGLARVLLVLVLLAGAVAWWAAGRYQRFADGPIEGLAPGSSLVLERGDSFAPMLRKLREAGAAGGHDTEWRVLARQTGAAGRLQVGEY